MKKNANEKIMMCQTLNGKLQKLLTKQPAM